MRLDKFISHATDLSRSQVRKALKAGTISVNNETVKDPARHILGEDRVHLNGEAINSPRARYFMLYKPPGYVCATKDGEHPTVLDLMHEPHREQLHIAGRLDRDTTGLVLITDDGKWNHRITSPRHRCQKKYRVHLAEPVAGDAAAKCARGVWLHGEKKRTLPATLESLAEREVSLTIQEGRYHQVKRMFAALGNRVVRLHRQSVGAIELDPRLAPGQYRPLTPQEIGTV